MNEIQVRNTIFALARYVEDSQTPQTSVNLLECLKDIEYGLHIFRPCLQSTPIGVNVEELVDVLQTVITILDEKNKNSASPP